MQIEEGDIVQITAALMLAIKDNHPTIYEQLSSNKCTSGKVLRVDGNKIVVDMGEALRGPLSVEVVGDPRLVLQIIRKASETGELRPYVASPAQYEQVAPQGFMPPFMFAPFPQFPGQAESEEPPDEVPEKVRMCQWVITQMLHQKQYGIIQDLKRIPDSRAPRYSAGDVHDAETFRQSGEDFRPVVIPLSGAEEQVYNTCLRKIQDWVTEKEPEIPEICNISVAEV